MTRRANLPSPVIQRTLDPRFLSYMASCDAASKSAKTCHPTHLNPRFLSYMASDDVFLTTSGRPHPVAVQWQQDLQR